MGTGESMTENQKPYGDDAFLNELAAILAELKALVPDYQTRRWMLDGNRALLRANEAEIMKLIRAHEDVLHTLARGRGWRV